MPTSGFAPDFFDTVLGNARETLSGFVGQLPTFPSRGVTDLPQFNTGQTDLPQYGTQAPGAPLMFDFMGSNPFRDLPTFGAPSQAGAGGMGDMLSGMMNNARQTAVSQRAADAASRRTPTTGDQSYTPSRTDTRIAQRITAEAQRLGLDPTFALWVAENEGGLDDAAANRRNYQGSDAYGPYQLMLNGGLGDEALARGIDPRDANSWEQQITFALEHVAQNGWGAWEAVTKRGIDPQTGTPRAPTAPTAPVSVTQGGSGKSSAWEQTYGVGNLTPDQYQIAKYEGLDDATADAVCGPAAAIAFARANGRTPSMTEALALAREVGWTKQYGMAGTQSQGALLTKMGIGNQVVMGKPDWNAVAQQVMAGRPVIIDAGDHYMVAEEYDPQTRKFNFGNSARVLRKAGKNSWFSPDELPGLSSSGLRINPEGTIYMTGGR